MSRNRPLGLALSLLLAHAAQGAGTPAEAAPYPASTYQLTIDWKSQRRLAPGSDNWATSWAADGKAYTIWGDGGGFDARFPYPQRGLVPAAPERCPLGEPAPGGSPLTPREPAVRPPA